MFRSIPVFFLVLTCCCGSTTAQTESKASLPPNWKTLSAEEFVDTADALFTKESSLTPKQKHQILSHAWQAFLSDTDFIASGDWTTIEVIAQLFVAHQEALFEGLEGEDLKAAQARLASHLDGLQDTLRARLIAETHLIAGLSIDDWRLRENSLKLAGMSYKNRAEFTALWIKSNAWKDLPIGDLAWLVGTLNVNELPNDSFSVRWTGSLTAPRSTSYTFEQLHEPYALGTMSIWLNGELVLDTSEANGSDSENAYRSQPITLTAGQKTALRIEYHFDSNERTGRKRLYHPTSMVMWEAKGMTKQIIPQGVLKTDDGERGLLGEYFADPQFRTTVGTRIEPGPEMIFSSRAVFSKYRALQQELYKVLRPRLARELGETDQGQLFGQIMPLMTATERMKFLESLADQPSVLDQMTFASFAKLFEQSCMLPSEAHLDLLAKWGERREFQPSRPGVYPGREDGSYYALNYAPPKSVAQFLHGDFWPSAEYLMEDWLATSDGSCNQTLVQVLAFAARLEAKTLPLRLAVEEQLQDESLEPDQRATWLLARKFLAEVGTSTSPAPRKGKRYLEEAALTAEDTQLKYFIHAEEAAQLISLGEEEEALQALDRADRYAGSREQAQNLKSLRSKATQLADLYRERSLRSSEIRAAALRRSMTIEIKRRHASAVAAGDDVAAERYSNQLRAFAEQASN